MKIHFPQPLHGWREFTGEVGVIVLGVLIALGAQQAVEWVHFRNEQRNTLKRLFEEARVNVTELRNRQPNAAMIQLEIDFATELTNWKSCPPAKKWAAVETSNMYRSVTVQTSVYDEIVGAGGLAEIGSTSVRDAVAKFHSRLKWVQDQTDFFRSGMVSPVELDDPRRSLVYDSSARDPSIVRFDRQALCSDPGFQSRVVESVRNHVVWDRYRLGLADDAIRMCAVLAAELGVECTPSGGAPFTDAERRVAEGALLHR